jgi:hypothetical protein
MSYRAKKILTVILFLFFGTMFFSKSIRSFFADDTMKLITAHKEKIDTVGAKHKSYVTRKIDEARKMFDELDDGMSQYKYGNKIMKDENIWEAKRVGDIEYKNIRNQYLNIFRKEAQQLEKVKNTLRDEGITETDFIQDERYRKAIVYAFEQIGFMFSSHAVRFFTECDQFEADSRRHIDPQCDTFYNHISKKYFDSGYVSEKLNYLTQLKKEMGNVFLISDERERVNKITVLHNNISSIYFTEIEKDNEIRLARYATENAAKALLPYKGFIFEILNAQNNISKSEADKSLKQLVWDRCIYEMKTKYSDNDKKAYKSCDERINDYSTGLYPKKYLPHEYYNLDYYVSGKTLIKFLESYKDFGVNDNE